MPAIRKELLLSERDYLEGERKSPIKHEYFAGEVFAMAGATINHNRIVANTLVSLTTQLKPKGCSVFSSDLRVYNPATRSYVYPDVVVCGKEAFLDKAFDTLLNPILLVEVLSDSTHHRDTGMKLGAYMQIPSLKDYLVISQSSLEVIHYTRQDENWLVRVYQGAQHSIELPHLECTLALADMYERVMWDETDQQAE